MIYPDRLSSGEREAREARPLPDAAPEAEFTS